MSKLRARHVASIASVTLLVLVLVLPGLALAKAGGVTIQEGILKYRSGHYLAGQPLTVGFDPFGYNYKRRGAIPGRRCIESPEL